MPIYKILSALLDYPEQDLKAALPQLRARLAREPLAEQERAALEGFLAWVEANSLTELEAAYVQTFDLTPEHSLHLTHHLFGDDRGRGPALIEMTEYYREFGMEPASEELPDYLPLILEFAAGLEELEAQLFLTRSVPVLGRLAANLEKAGSPYAPLVRIIENRGRLARIAA